VLFGLSFVFVPDLSNGFSCCLILALLAATGFSLVHGCVSLAPDGLPVGWVNLSPKETPKVADWGSPSAGFFLC
jgi:hypothetical protein